MRIGGVRLGWLRRRWWVIAFCTLGVAAIASAISLSAPTTYTAESVLLVRSGATTNTPGNANEANRLAVTYSQLIPEDSQIVDRVAATLGVGRDAVLGQISGVNDANTSILRLRYTSDDASQAIDGARALADAVVGPQPASTNFNGLSLSRLPDSAESSSSFDTSLPAGIVLGLCLGLVLAVLWERVDGRFDNIRDVEDRAGCPVSPLEELSTTSMEVLLKRWYGLAGVPNARIAMLPATEDSKLDIRAVVTAFESVLASVTPSQGGAPKIDLVAGGAVGSDQVGELAAQAADLTIFVVPARMKAARYEAAVEQLRDLGIRPGWVLFASRRARRQLARMAGGEPATA